MIYCIAFDDIVAALAQLGFVRIEQAGSTIIFARGSEDFTIRGPNQRGDLPEMIVNDAFDAAGLPMPPWDVHWCD